ncbi:hypothetical protein ACFPRL_20700 [Pseudoclavibacter helvolus]
MSCGPTGGPGRPARARLELLVTEVEGGGAGGRVVRIVGILASAEVRDAPAVGS